MSKALAARVVTLIAVGISTLAAAAPASAAAPPGPRLARAVRFVKRIGDARVRNAQGAACLVSAQRPGADLPGALQADFARVGRGQDLQPAEAERGTGTRGWAGTHSVERRPPTGRSLRRARATFLLTLSRPAHKTRRATVRVTLRG